MQANAQRVAEVRRACVAVVKDIDEDAVLGNGFVLAVKVAESITGDALSSPETKAAAQDMLDAVESALKRAAERAAAVKTTVRTA